MNLLLANSLFDNPWVVGAVIIIGTIINWLAKRREEQKARQPAGEKEPETETAPAEFDLAETLRRFLGEGELPQTSPPSLPDLGPPPLPATASTNLDAILQQQQDDAARRFEELSDHTRHPVKVVTHEWETRSHAARRNASRWRDPRKARQAFVASLIFAPPKCMEP